MNILNNEIQNITFQALKSDEKVHSVIHIILENDDKIKGQLERIMLEIPYMSLPKNMIDTISIDLDGMKTGTEVFVKDIPELMTKKIELLVDVKDAVFRINEKKRVEVKQPEEESIVES